MRQQDGGVVGNGVGVSHGPHPAGALCGGGGEVGRGRRLRGVVAWGREQARGAGEAEPARGPQAAASGRGSANLGRCPHRRPQYAARPELEIRFPAHALTFGGQHRPGLGVGPSHCGQEQQEDRGAAHLGGARVCEQAADLQGAGRGGCECLERP